jgi:hypothetical protein
MISSSTRTLPRSSRCARRQRVSANGPDNMRTFWPISRPSSSRTARQFSARLGEVTSPIVKYFEWMPSQRGLQPRDATNHVVSNRQVVNSNFCRFLARCFIKLYRPVAYRESFCQNRARRFLRSEAKLRTPRRRAREPKLVAEITYLAWTVDSLLRHAVYVGLREEKPAEDVRREAARMRRDIVCRARKTSGRYER